MAVAVAVAVAVDIVVSSGVVLGRASSTVVVGRVRSKTVVGTAVRSICGGGEVVGVVVLGK